MTVRAPDHMSGGEFAEQFEANLVVQADEKWPDRDGFRDAAGSRLLETAVAKRGPRQGDGLIVSDAAEFWSDFDCQRRMALRDQKIPCRAERQQREQGAKC